jgi:AsmA protein
MLRLKPSASLYGGTYGGDIDLAIQGDSARMTLSQQIAGVDLVPLGNDLLGSKDIAGKGDVKLDLVATGSNLGAMRRGLDGNVSFNVANGALEGIDLWYELRRARATIDRTPVPERPNGPRRTTFSSLAATGTVEDAVLTNKDLRGALDFMTIVGNGTVNLLDNKIAFDLKASLTDGPTLQSDPAMAKMAGQTLPLKVSGTLDEPSVLPDFAKLASDRAKSEVNKAVDEQKQKAQDKLKDKLKGLFDR